MIAITPDLILRAYEITGITPVAGTCYLPDRLRATKHTPEVPGPCGCALGALVLAFERHNPAEDCGTGEAIAKLGLPFDAGQWLAHGFDQGLVGGDQCDEPATAASRQLYAAGHEAGRRLRDRFGKALPSEVEGLTMQPRQEVST